MKNKLLVSAIEKNIDGCGSDAEVLMYVDIPEGESPENLLHRLQDEMKRIKAEAIAADDCLDTDTIVNTAVENLQLKAEWLFPQEITF